MAGKAINQYNEYTGQPSGVNILVQEQSQSEPTTFEHKKADLDALLNKKIVQTITDNDTTHVPSADAVYDALLTESTARASADTTLGQNITDEETARQNADTTLGQRINATNKRVTNLEQKAGDEIVVDYPDSTYGRNEVPASVAEYAKIKSIVGKSRAWNQLVIFSSISSWADGGIAVTNNNDGSFTVNGTALNDVYFVVAEAQNIVSGRIYLVKGVPSGGSISTFYGYFTGGLTTYDQGNGQIKTATSSGNVNYVIYIKQGTVCNNLKFVPILRDLTLYFNGTIPSDADTIAEIQTNYPELLIPSDYDAGSLVSTTYSGVKSVGVNLWDEEWETGQYNPSNGQPMSGFNAIRSKNYIPAKALTEYLVKLPSGVSARTFFYDKDKNFIGTVADALSTTIAGTAYIKFHTSTNYGSSYANNIQVCLNSLPDVIKSEYHAHMESTLSLPSPVELRSAGSVADTDELNVEVVVDGVKVNKRRQTVRINEADLGQCDWVYDYDYSVMRTDSLTDMSIADNWSALICAKYTVVNSNTPYVHMPDKSCKRQSITANFVIKDSDLAESDIVNNKIAKLLGTKLTYETATYSVTLLDPILDPFIKVEGGGTIRPIQTQTTEIDSAMTAEYLAV